MTAAPKSLIDILKPTGLSNEQLRKVGVHVISDRPPAGPPESEPPPAPSLSVAPTLKAALEYAARGIPVFPCRPRAKEPQIEGGFHRATTDESQIRAWWGKWPLANIGIPTGKASGFIALDVDPGGDESLAKLTAEHGPLPSTCEVKTGRGRQLWFSYPSIPIRNSAGALGAGLDIRGEGGYVIVPPSIHPNGAHYAFSNDSQCEPMPEWLILLVSQSKATPQPSASGNGTGEKIRQGSRHDTLVSLAGTMRRRGFGESAICAALLAHNKLCCDPPLPESEVVRIAADYGKKPAGAASTPSGARPEGFSLVSLGELLARPEVPVDWVLEDHLAAGTVSGGFSKPKVGKSTLARNLCLAVARGTDFLGSRVKKGLCIYLALEEREEDVVADFRAMGATGDEQILVHADAIPSAGIHALIDLVQERKPALVVIDPLIRMVHVRDEKAYAEIYAALGPLIDVARSIGTHIHVTHHAGKALKLDPVDSPLGSTGIAGACSSLIILKRTEAYRTIQTVQRIGQDMPETILAFDPATRRLSVGGTRLEADREACEAEILEFLSAADTPLTQAQIRAGVEGQTRIIRAALTALAESGRIGKSGDGAKGKPFLYKFPNSGSHYIGRTTKPECEKAAQTRMDTEAMLVPTLEQETILVLEGKTSPKPAISGRLEAVENVAEGSTSTPPSEGESVATPKPVGVGKQWRY